jgi:hypothetical protein
MLHAKWKPKNDCEFLKSNKNVHLLLVFLVIGESNALKLHLFQLVITAKNINAHYIIIIHHHLSYAYSSLLEMIKMIISSFYDRLNYINKAANPLETYLPDTLTLPWVRFTRES